MPVRKSTAVWNGSLKEGSGRMRLASGLYEGPFTFSSRFEEGAGTNPDELVAAAHAGCFSMFLASLLADRATRRRAWRPTSAVHLGAGPTITKIELDTQVKVAGVDDAQFQELAAQAKKDCPVSKALAAVPEIVLTARLVG